MRYIALILGLLGCIAAFAVPATIDLDKPGVLEQLRESHPQQFQAIAAVLQASERLPCKSGELQTVKVHIKNLECNVLLLTSFPAKRHVSFEFDGTSYAATVVLKDSADFKVHSAVAAQPADEKK